MPALLTSLSTRGKITVAASAVAFLAAAIMLFKLASAPSYTEIMAGIQPAQTGKVTAALDGAGVNYELRGNGTAIAVDSGQVAQARMALATAGVSGTAKQPGYELLDKQKLGASNFQQQVAYQRALEGQISNTISEIDGVGGASVSLTLPKDQLFADESQAATAAVLLQGDATSLDPGAVRGIANLVASSVQGLKTDNVTITDASGSLLWPQGDSAGGAGGGTSKQAAQARYDAQLTAKLDAMLASTLGAGKAHVQVHSDLNVDQATQEKLQYAKTGTPLKQVKDTETLRGTGSTSGGTTGAAANIPAYAQQTAGGNGTSNYRHVQETTDLGVDKTITKTTIAPGAVNRMDVAVVVDKAAKIAPADLAALKSSIASAAGIQPTRGDTLAVSTVAFAKAAAPKAAGPVPAGMLKYVKGVLLGLAALLVLFFLVRQVRKREGEAFAEEPSWLRALHEPARLGPGSAMDDPTEIMSLDDGFDPAAAARTIFENDPRAIALEELVQREPEKVAHQLRNWITEDGS